MAKASDGDTKDFEAVALSHLGAVYRAAVALCDRRDEAEDLVQATFLKALERYNSFQQGTNCRAWLLRILRNTWIDQLRHKRIAGPALPVEDALVVESSRSEQIIWSDAQDILESFSDQQVIDALYDLPEEQRLTLFMADVVQLGHEEIADIMGVAVGTVKSRASRARAILKKKLMAYAQDLGLMGRDR